MSNSRAVNMQLWTHHPSTFQLADPELIVDPTKGQYWCSEQSGFRYREVFPKLHRLVGSDQFIWCYTIFGQFIRPAEETDVVEWELNVPVSSQIRLLRVQVWEDIVWSRSDDWQNLFVDGNCEAGADIHALVLLPLEPSWIKCKQKVRPVFSKDIMEQARRIATSTRPQNPDDSRP